MDEINASSRKIAGAVMAAAYSTKAPVTPMRRASKPASRPVAKPSASAPVRAQAQQKASGDDLAWQEF